MKKLTKWLIATSVILFSSTNGATEETIRLTAGEWPPYLSEELKHHGVAAHIISDIFALEGIKVKYDFVSWGRAFDLAKEGDVDGTAIWLWKEEREKYFIYSEPLIKEEHVFFHLKSYSFDWKTIDDLKRIDMGLLIGFSYGPMLDQGIKEGKLLVERVPKDVQNFRKLLIGRIQIYPQEKNVGYLMLKKHFKQKNAQLVTNHPKAFLKQFSYLILSRKIERNKAMLELFNKGLRQLKASGKYDAYLEASRQGDYLKMSITP